MGCDWIRGEGTVFGCSVSYDDVFAGTAFAADDYIPVERAQQDLSSAWAAFRDEHLPSAPGILALLATTEMPGFYESTRCAAGTVVVFGYPICEPEGADSPRGSCVYSFPNMVFPPDFKLLVRSFVDEYSGSQCDSVYGPELVVHVA